MIGRTFRWGRSTIEIVGVAPRGFTGTEPGRMTDFFVPATLNAQALNSPGWSWFRIWVRPNDGTSPEQVRQLLQAQAQTRPPGDGQVSPVRLARPENHRLPERADPARASGGRRLRAAARIPTSDVHPRGARDPRAADRLRERRQPARRSGRRARTEMALRVSIGAGRGRLIQLVLVEGALLAVCASIAGAVFAWWAAPVRRVAAGVSRSRCSWC